MDHQYLNRIKAHSHSRTKLRLNPLDFLKSQTKRKKGEESGDEQNELVKRIRENPTLKSFFETQHDSVLWQIGLNLGYPAIIDLCETSSTLKRRICDNDTFWSLLTTQEWDKNAALKHFVGAENPWKKRFFYFIEELPRKSELNRFLNHDTRITELYLNVNKIGSEGAKAIAEVLKENNTLTKLNLHGNGIRSEGAKAIGRALVQNQTLTYLDLSDNGIRSTGAKAIAEALKENNTLTKLNLHGNGIGSDSNGIGLDGVKAITEALKENNTLTKLDLGFNNIGNEEAKAIAEALKENNTLTSLDLSGNDIWLEGAKAIAEALRENSTLTKLNLYGNIIELYIIQLMMDTIRNFNKTVSISF